MTKKTAGNEYTTKSVATETASTDAHRGMFSRKTERAGARERERDSASTRWSGITYLSISFFSGNDSLSWATIIYLKETDTFHMPLLCVSMYVCVCVRIIFPRFLVVNHRCFYRNNIFFLSYLLSFFGKNFPYVWEV